MIQPAACEPQARADVLGFEIRHFFDDLFGGKPICQEIQHITHPNTHPAKARAPPALLRVNRNAIHQLNHSNFLSTGSSSLSSAPVSALPRRRLASRPGSRRCAPAAGTRATRPPPCRPPQRLRRCGTRSWLLRAGHTRYRPLWGIALPLHSETTGSRECRARRNRPTPPAPVRPTSLPGAATGTTRLFSAYPPLAYPWLLVRPP